jgi:predicted nucleic acid-binding protein
VVEAMTRAQIFKICRIGLVETERAVALGGGPEQILIVREGWASADFIEVDEGLADHAVTLAVEHRLRALDALHLAAALTLVEDNPVFATWDRRLHEAARAEGLATLPAELD